MSIKIAGTYSKNDISVIGEIIQVRQITDRIKEIAQQELLNQWLDNE